MPRQQKYQTPTVQLSVRVPAHLMLALDVESKKANQPRAEILVGILSDRYAKPVPAKLDVFG